VDARSLALFRVTLGLVLCADLLARLRLVDTLFSNDGVLTNHFSLFRPLAPFQFSLFAAASSTRDVTVVFWLTLVVYALFTVGYRTRLFQVISFILVTSLHSRNLLTELPSDIPLHLFMAWSLVMPLGARFSIDNVRKSLRSVEETSPDELNVRPPTARTFTSIAVLGMLLQLAIVHLVPALRQDGSTWADGTALYYALRQNLWVTNAGTWVAEHLSLDGIKRLTSLFRASELAIGVLVLVPMWYVRRAAAVALVVFHLASRLLWNLGPYEWVLLATVPFLLTSRDWDGFGRWYVRKKPALTVYFDADCGICFALCRLLKRLDSLGRLTFAPGSSDDAPAEVKALAAETVVVRDAAGRTFTRSRAVSAIFGSLALGTPLALLLRAPGISSLADFAYDKVAKNRAAISVWFGYEACGVKSPADREASSAAQDEPIAELERARAVSREVAAALFLGVCAAALVLRMNDETKPHGWEAPIFSIVAYPRLYQDWKLFAPDPPRRQGVVVVDAQTGRGQKVDPLTGQPPLEALVPGKPDPRARPAPLMAAYFSNINQPARTVYVDEMKNYVQRLSDLREAGDKLTWFNVNWIEAPIPSPDIASATAEVVPPRKITSRP
jgi:predicted DCC family thiol-disulfide oxidoreductase YuxK